MWRKAALSLLTVFLIVSSPVYAQHEQNQPPSVPSEGVDRSWQLQDQSRSARPERDRSQQQYAVPRTTSRPQQRPGSQERSLDNQVDRSWRLQGQRYRGYYGDQYVMPWVTRPLFHSGFNSFGRYNRRYYQGGYFDWLPYPRIWIRLNTCIPGYWAYDYYGLVWVQGYCNIYGYRPPPFFYWPY